MPRLEKNSLFDDRYILLNKLGSGGYSEVWLARDNKAGLEVALKVFAPDKGMDDKGIEIFSKEYSLVFNLNHSNLLKPSHFDDFEGSPYLVLPYCPNGSALDKIGEFDEHELAKFMLHSASALAYLHDQNPPIIHQDIKPDNFLIDDKGNYLLSDFGISSRIKRALTRSVGRQNSSGTLPYMPPERFVKERQIIKASDVFSLGVTFYELLTGELPFGEHGGLLLNTGAEIPDLPSKFSPEMNKIIELCLSKEPWNRPFADQLANLASEYLKTGKWNISLIEKKSETDSSLEEIPVEPAIQPVKKEGRKTEKITFVDEQEVQIPDPGSKVPDKPEEPVTKKTPGRKKKPFLFIAAGIVIVALVVFFITNSQKKEVKTPEIAATDTAKANKLKKLKEDSILQAQIEKRKKDSLLALKDLSAKSNNQVQNPDKQTESPKTNLPSIYCSGHYVYVSLANNSTYSTWQQAVALCRNLVAYGYDDWRLPSKDELGCMFDQQSAIGGFGNHDFWSSTSSGEFAVSQNFGDGHLYPNTYKDEHAYVRCIR